MSGGVLVRNAEAADYAHFARLQPELHTNDRLPEKSRWVAQMSRTTLMVEHTGRVVAYGWYEVYGSDGYVRHVVVAPEARGQGFGRRAMLAMAERMRAAGCRTWQLNVKKDNEPAIALYRSLGMDADFDTAVVRLPWESIAALPRHGRALEAREARPEEDRELERGFDLPEGRISKSREFPRVRIVRLVDVGAPAYARLGVACYDPSFPGCFPFRVTRVELARTLLEALVPHRPEDSQWIQLVVEDDVLLAQALSAAGGKIQFEITHLRGPLPGTTQGKRPAGPGDCRSGS